MVVLGKYYSLRISYIIGFLLIKRKILSYKSFNFLTSYQTNSRQLNKLCQINLKIKFKITVCI